MTPYASIIVPTHDRHATLAAAVSSVRRQTVTDIEILISGDGATDEVREVAQAICAADSRVRFIDRPKAPARGGANRNLAVREAAAERIFYIDDDDLWARGHVATLGAALDHADVADSVVVSLGRSGRLHMQAADNSDPARRKSFGEGGAKLVFDTHLAHRKTAYLASGTSWATGADPVRQLFGILAGNPAIRWRSIAKATALSLHGAARRSLTPADRQAEIETWAARTQDGEIDLTGVSPAWYSHHLAIRDEHEPVLLDGCSDDQLEIFRSAWTLGKGGRPDQPDLSGVILSLMDRVLNEEPSFRQLARRLSLALGEESLAHLDRIASRDPGLGGQAALMRGHLLRVLGRRSEADDALAPSMSAEPWIAAEGLLLKSALGKRKDPQRAAALAARATGLAPWSTRAWREQFTTALAAGRLQDARDAIARLEALGIDPVRTQSLQDRLSESAGAQPDRRG